MEELTFQILDVYSQMYESKNRVHMGFKPAKLVLERRKIEKKLQEDNALTREFEGVDLQLQLCNVGHFGEMDYKFFGELVERK